MSETKKLKEKFHLLIDQIDHEDLEEFYDLIIDYYHRDNVSKDIIDELDDVQKSKLEKAIKSADEGKLIEHEEALKRIFNK